MHFGEIHPINELKIVLCLQRTVELTLHILPSVYFLILGQFVFMNGKNSPL